MLSDFKKFILRGNIVDLAVAVVVGVAFTAMITALVADLITPLIAAIFGKPNFSDLTFTVNHSTFKYGSFINALLSFLIVATVVFFAVVVPLTALMRRLNVLPTEEPKPETHECPECLSDIPVAGTTVCLLHDRSGGRCLAQPHAAGAGAQPQVQGGVQPGGRAVRWRATSKQATAPATPTLSDGRVPCCGMAATASQRRRTSGASPFSSLPTTNATGPSPSGRS